MSDRAGAKIARRLRQDERTDQERCVAVGPFSCQWPQNMPFNNGKQRIFVAGYRSPVNCSLVPSPAGGRIEDQSFTATALEAEAVIQITK